MNKSHIHRKKISNWFVWMLVIGLFVAVSGCSASRKPYCGCPSGRGLGG